MLRQGAAVVAASWLVCASAGLAAAGVSDAWITPTPELWWLLGTTAFVIAAGGLIALMET